MTLDDIHFLYSYDRWANRRLLDASARLTPEQFTRDLGGSFRCVRDTLLHIISGEWVWLQYWKSASQSPEVVSRLQSQRAVEFDAERFPAIAAVMAKWFEVESQQRGFLDALTEEGLRELVEARGTRIPLVHLMLHVTNHSTYHRGQVTLMIRQLGGEPAATDFHVFVAEQRVGIGTTAD